MEELFNSWDKCFSNPKVIPIDTSLDILELLKLSA
jgi:hypothetical protein